MLRWKSKFDEKFVHGKFDEKFVHGINRKIFRAPPGSLSLKTLVLVGLITKI